MSFESSAFPVTVCAPETTQLLEPNTPGGSESTSDASKDPGNPNPCGGLGDTGLCHVRPATELSEPETRSSSSVFSSNLFSSNLSSSNPFSSNPGRDTVGGRSCQEEFTYKSAVSSEPSLARIFSRASACL